MIEKKYYVYIATNKANRILYTGVTSSLLRRAYQHENRVFSKSFTSKYKVNKIVYFEIYSDVYMAINREKQIKAGSRKNKIKLINSINLKWIDLVKEIEKGNEVLDGNSNIE